ncbi:thioredoxin [Actinoplanes ianthinogenes]|uniref:Thioredoxin n=1 Tax=Actinoplanes ianthinogenes TaxID=122358 RepID=A0ABN6CLJ2_9ACTN|nr:hypothetical protein [Actinoplanes ianthinogenes]BCJ45923.1 thioredoxin [Actinoplanes ianthinogenes]GGR31116.1 thioredoxin [Actinoplanes ianthinogenes]
MSPPDPDTVAARIEGLLAALRAGPDPRAADTAEELVRCLVQLYGAGLGRITAALGPERVTELCADPLVASLLLIHDLHPVPAADRIRAAVPGAVIDLDPDGTVHVHAAEPAPGCGGTRQALVQRIEAAVRRAAPEAGPVDVRFPPARPALLQISRRPGAVRSP